MIEYIVSPLTEDQLRAKVKDGRLKVVFAISLGDLASGGSIDGLNDWVDEHVWDGVPTLSDLAYKPVEVDGDFVLVELDADASEVLDEIGEPEE